MSENESEKKPDKQIEYIIPCPECRSGVMHLRYITYFTWLSGQLVTVPNFPAWTCDVCGRREYDSRAISWLNTMLNPLAGKRPVSRRRSRLPGHGHLPPPANE
jgi:YgiT-type zinc finger domain-containing protein